MYNFLTSILSDGVHTYNILATVIIITLVVISIYNRIKYLCLEKAAKKVAEVEKDEQLTGKEKFALVMLWINNDLPNIFKNALFQSILEKIVQYAYKSSKEYAENYIKRKTGMDVSKLIENLSVTNDTSSVEVKNDNATDN